MTRNQNQGAQAPQHVVEMISDSDTEPEPSAAAAAAAVESGCDTEPAGRKAAEGDGTNKTRSTQTHMATRDLVSSSPTVSNEGDSAPPTLQQPREVSRCSYPHDVPALTLEPIHDKTHKLALAKHFGGGDAACFSLLRGATISPINHHKLLEMGGAQVANCFVKRVLYEDDERGYASAIRRLSPRLPGPRCEAELEHLFFFVLAHSKEMSFSFNGSVPDEPWIADFRETAAHALLDAGVQPLASAILKIAKACLESVDQQKVASVEDKSKATRKRKAARKEAVAQRYGAHVNFGDHPVPDERSTVARAAFRPGDFDEHGELHPDSDCDEADSEWHGKKARYCELAAQKGEGMDLQGRGPWAPRRPGLDGLPLVVYYDEDGSDSSKNVPYAAKVVEAWYDSRDSPALLVRFQNDEQAHITDEDEWHWSEPSFS